jgi:IMP dehydrogenase/GMP reductase
MAEMSLKERLMLLKKTKSNLMGSAHHTRAREGTMLKTRLRELLGIEAPIILAPMETCTSAELAAAVSN